MESLVKWVHLQIDLASHQEALFVLVVTRNGWLNHLYINHRCTYYITPSAIRGGLGHDIFNVA